MLKSKDKIVGKKNLYKNYSHLGEANRKELQKLNAGKPVSIKHSNFLTYAYKSAEKMEQKEIKHQVAKHWKHIQNFFAVLENEYKK